MSLSKYFRFPFALAGDKAAIPDATQPSGDVSFQEGYGLDYQLDPATEPSAKNIERDKANQLYYDITQAIKEYQEFGAPYWIEAAQNGGVAFAYEKYALVRYDIGGGETPIFQSLVDSNTDLPTVTASWQRLASANPFIVDNATFEASVSNGEIVYWDNVNSRFDEAIADGTAAQNAVGMADVTNAKVYLFGAIPAGVISGLTANVAYYLSTVTPGAITSIKPASNALQVGVSKSSTTFFLNITSAYTNATETAAGLAELATSAEAIAGTNDTTIITPLKLRNGLNAAGTAPIYACRAWVNFNGTGTVAIRASGNVSSITDNGVGDYTVNFTTAMPDANYSATGMNTITSPGYVSLLSIDGVNTGYMAASSFRFRTIKNEDGRTNQDTNIVTIGIFR